VVYDFKEIRQNIVDNLSKIYTILYVDKKVEFDDIDYNVYNTNCASLLKIQDDVGEYDIKWNYIHNYQYNETDFVMLDGNITPLYMDILDNSPVKELFSNYYLSGDNNNLMFDYKKLISQILDVLYSDKFEDEYGNRIKEIHKITDDEITVDFMKPEAIYLGLEFPEENISNISDMLNDYDIQLFKIDKKDDKLFKKLV
ncbi:MAG: hypothetical protein LUG89_05970, partial [Methanosphaera sp.]|nr:hypothetical protein [Methanosphaera sp.]